MKKSKIIIVDNNDNPIALKYRDEVDYQKDIYRCTGIWITNSKEEILIAQRKITKDINPGKWGPAVAGTIEEGETYESNAYKELKEEIGLTGVKLEVGQKQRSTSPRNYFGQWFTCKVDKPIKDFVIQEDEVAQIRWINKNELVGDLKNNPDKYVPSLYKAVDLFIK